MPRKTRSDDPFLRPTYQESWGDWLYRVRDQLDRRSAGYLNLIFVGAMCSFVAAIAIYVSIPSSNLAGVDLKASVTVRMLSHEQMKVVTDVQVANDSVEPNQKSLAVRFYNPRVDSTAQPQLVPIFSEVCVSQQGGPCIAQAVTADKPTIGLIEKRSTLPVGSNLFSVSATLLQVASKLGDGRSFHANLPLHFDGGRTVTEVSGTVLFPPFISSANSTFGVTLSENETPGVHTLRDPSFRSAAEVQQKWTEDGSQVIFSFRTTSPVSEGQTLYLVMNWSEKGNRNAF